MKKLVYMAMVLALSAVVLGGCKKKEAKPEEKAANAISKVTDSAKQAVTDANEAVQDAAKK